MKALLLRGNGIWENHPFAYYWRLFYLTWLLVGSSTMVTRGQASILWDKTIGGDNYDFLRTTIRTSDGGYLLGGYSASGVSGDKSQASRGGNDYWIVKLNADGTQAWNKTLGGNAGEILSSIQQTGDGGYIVGGYSASGISGDKSEGNRGSVDYWVVKLKADGSKVWDKTYGGNQNDHLEALQQTSDGGYILGGRSSSGASADKSQAAKGGTDFWIVKLKADGSKEWDETIGSAGDDEFASLQQTSDGGYILGGYTDWIGGDKTQASKGALDYWIVKLNASGTKVWDKTIGGSSYDRLEVVQQTPDGGYILGGNSASGISGDKSEGLRDIEEIPDLFPSDYWVVKLKADGTKVWDKTLGGTKLDFISSILQTNDGSYILGGSSESGVSGEKTGPNKGERDFWVVKINTNGHKLWDKTIGGNRNDILVSVQAAGDGAYLLGGYSNTGINGDKTEASKDFNFSDYWGVKLKEDIMVNTAWNRRFGGTEDDNFTGVIPTLDGGYLYGGFTNSGLSGDKSQSSWGKNDFWIVKSDKNGKKLWDKRYGGSGDDFLTNLIQTQDGGYLLGGSSLSGVSGDKSQASRGDRDYWVVKIDAQGNKEWDKRFGGSGYDELKKVLQLPSGRYILAGTSSSPASGDKSQGSQGAQDYWILKISTTGTKQWDKRFGGLLNDAFADLALTLDGGFLLGGTSVSGIGGDKTQSSRGSNDYWLVRITGEGVKIWDQRYGGTKEDVLLSLGSTGTSSGNFFIAGHSNSPVSGEKTQESQGGTDYWMLKINPEGNKLWDKRFGGSQQESLRSISITKDGGYVLGGSSYSGISGDKTQTSWGSSDYWLVKTNDKGVKEWDKRFGGNSYEELRTVRQTADGGYILGGKSTSGISGNKTQPSQGGTDYWLVKVAPLTTSMVAVREETATEEAAKTEVNLFKVYPNPAKEQVRVSFTLPQTQAAEVKVYDSQGREIATLFQGEAKADHKYELEWQAGNKPAGMYLLQLRTSTKRYLQKLLLAK
ncbi:hypothetical protein AHMF7605_17470 [Adhaeribacter arboris]|uniref:Secretion system C-terminal sorting domain-containing protein n=1 Tax=Adhaeribacter arboris TaxID=2072846 RepID=A0A2T2YI29_9BACT|nr:T9SS type A sorting domain-containing protein [Adhaeribacter arboris]PSR55169.1 hypothetical protein AHMF7605_17470 [Adhaeribacter arboris]